jgi:diguanylate cyclase (GGDEF)-like protein
MVDKQVEDDKKLKGRLRLNKPYMWLINVLGGVACLFALLHFPSAQVDLRFLLLASLTVIVSSRVSVRIPRANTTITVSDAFIFLTMLLYNPEAAILLAAAEGTCSGLRLSKTPRTVLFNAGAMTCSTFLTTSVLHLILGPQFDLRHQPYSIAIAAICVMGLVQYIANTGLVAVCLSLKSDQPLWPTWSKHYLWSSVTYFAGAAVAGLIASSVGMIGLYAVLLTIPMISILYFTYHKYLEDIRATAAQAEQAERERAEAEHARAEAERERAEQFRYAAFHDALTNLPNRALLTENLKAVIERAKQEADYQFAVLFLDLDRFKNINDSLGHTIGDQLLVTIARRLEHSVRETDTVARLGGDEFAILLNGIKHSDDAIQMTERIQKEISMPFSLSGHEVFTTPSTGIALSVTGYDDPDDILRDADTAMYHAKERGKACYEMFDQSMHARAVNLLRLETDLRRALEREEFFVHYQPIVSLETGTLSGFEALVRWQHPERGFISPAEFVSVAEDTRLIIPLGLWVLRESCRQMCQWQWQSPANSSLILSVNLSGKQLTQPDLVEQIEVILKETHLNPRCLKLEITESVVMENAESAIAMLQGLKALGLQLSIDDFGTGYSSLSYLHRFPVDTLKIDRSFVSQMSMSDENAEIVRTIKTLASNLGMDVVAEGVETLEQLKQLAALQCEYGQGYLFSKPVDAEAVTALLAKRPDWNVSAFSPTRESFVPARAVVSHLRSA